MTDPRDFEIARSEHWYRIPARYAPKGIHAEYVAFYFTKNFDESLRFAIHFYVRRTGHELVKRIDLLPGEPDHPRANEPYYKLQLGPMRQRQPPIVSVRWRRITFIHTTWDRFVASSEINDLFSDDDQFVDRVYHTLKEEHGVYSERKLTVKERDTEYVVDLAIPCVDGNLWISNSDERPTAALKLARELATDIESIRQAIRKRGGPRVKDIPLDD